MLGECTAFLKENEKTWKFESDKPRLKKKQEDKNRRPTLSKMQKDTLRKLKQQRISDTWKKLPEHERRHFLAEEEKLRRFELREAKVNIWKKWRQKHKNMSSQPAKKRCLEDTRPERLEETLERMKAEVQNRKKARIVEEKRKNNLLEEKKLKQEKMLRQELETRSSRREC